MSALQVPKEWANLKRARAGGAKVRDVGKKKYKSDAAVSTNCANSAEDICQAVCQNLSKCEDVDYELDFSDILSHIDYKGVLEGLFGGCGMGVDVPVISRTYEESFCASQWRMNASV